MENNSNNLIEKKKELLELLNILDKKIDSKSKNKNFSQTNNYKLFKKKISNILNNINNIITDITYENKN